MQALDALIVAVMTTVFRGVIWIAGMWSRLLFVLIALSVVAAMIGGVAMIAEAVTQR